MCSQENRSQIKTLPTCVKSLNSSQRGNYFITETPLISHSMRFHRHVYQSLYLVITKKKCIFQRFWNNFNIFLKHSIDHGQISMHGKAISLVFKIRCCSSKVVS